MHDTNRISAELHGRAQRWPQYESLPGQQELFSEWENGPSVQNRNCPTQRCELFETGKDLPGAMERDQTIFWDVYS